MSCRKPEHTRLSLNAAYDRRYARAAAAPALAQQGSLVSVAGLIASLRQNAALAVLIVVGTVLLTFAMRAAVPPYFPASVDLYIDPAQLDVVTLKTNPQDEIFDTEPLELKRFRVTSVSRYFTATAVLRPVVMRLGLDRDPEFVGGGALGAVRRLITGEGVASDPDAALAELQRRIGAEPVRDSYIVTLSVLSTDAGKAARIANAIAQEAVTFDQRKLTVQMDAARKEIDTARTKLESEVRAMGDEREKERSAAGLAGAGRDSARERDYTALSQSLNEARARAREAESRYNTAAAAHDGGLDLAGSTTTAAPALEALRQQVITARREELAASANGTRLPAAQAARARRTSAEEAFKAEAGRLLLSARRDMDAAKAEEADLSARLDTLKAGLVTDRGNATRLARSARDEASLVAIAGDLNRASGQAEARAAFDDKLTRVVGPASISLTPWRVDPVKAFLLSLASGAVLALALALARAPAAPAWQAQSDPFDGTRSLFWRLAAPAFIVLTVVMCTAAFYPLFARAVSDGEAAAGQSATAAGNPLYLLLWMGLYGLTGLVLLRDVTVRGLERNVWPGLAFIAYLLLSSLWAENAKSALYFGTLLALNVVIAYALAQIAVPQRVLRITSLTLGVLIVLSFVYLVVQPNRALAWSDGRGWFISKEMSGLFSHKVHMGTYSGLALLMALNDSLRTRFTLGKIVVIVFCILGLALANSATAVAATAMVCALLAVARRWPSAPYGWLFGLALAVFLFSVLVPVINLGAITELLGRDANLTGRGSFWGLAWPLASERAFGGHGYTTFFDVGPFSPVWAIYKDAQYFFTPNFHNSSLDVVISFGVPGLFGYALMVICAACVVFNRTITPHARLLLLGMLVLFTISSCFDFQFMRHNGMPSLVLFYLMFLTGKRVRPEPA